MVGHKPRIHFSGAHRVLRRRQPSPQMAPTWPGTEDAESKEAKRRKVNCGGQRRWWPSRIWRYGGRIEMDAEELSRWLKDRGEQDDLLYDRWGKQLEPEHSGEFVAIADDGRTIFGPDELSVLHQAQELFAPGTFALRRIGADAEVTWRAFR